jgi:hypothetical protein
VDVAAYTQFLCVLLLEPLDSLHLDEHSFFGAGRSAGPGNRHGGALDVRNRRDRRRLPANPSRDGQTEAGMLHLEMVALGIAVFVALGAFVAFCEWV